VKISSRKQIRQSGKKSKKPNTEGYLVAMATFKFETKILVAILTAGADHCSGL